MENNQAVQEAAVEVPAVPATPEQVQEAAYSEVFEVKPKDEVVPKEAEKAEDGKEPEITEEKKPEEKPKEDKPAPVVDKEADAEKKLLEFYGVKDSSPETIKALKKIHKTGLDLHSRVGFLKKQLTDATATISTLKSKPSAPITPVVDVEGLQKALKQLPVSVFEDMSEADRDMIGNPGFQKAFAVMFGLLSGNKVAEVKPEEKPSEVLDPATPAPADIRVVQEIAGQVAKISADLPPMLETYSSPAFDKFVREVVKSECEKNAVIFPDGADITALSPTFRRLISTEPTDHAEILQMFTAWGKVSAQAVEDAKKTDEAQKDLAGHGQTHQTRILDDGNLSPDDILSMPKDKYQKNRMKILKGG